MSTLLEDYTAFRSQMLDKDASEDEAEDFMYREALYRLGEKVLDQSMANKFEDFQKARRKEEEDDDARRKAWWLAHGDEWRAKWAKENADLSGEKPQQATDISERWFDGNKIVATWQQVYHDIANLFHDLAKCSADISVKTGLLLEMSPKAYSALALTTYVGEPVLNYLKRDFPLMRIKTSPGQPLRMSIDLSGEKPQQATDDEVMKFYDMVRRKGSAFMHGLVRAPGETDYGFNKRLADYQKHLSGEKPSEAQ
jgi:hypothetical protein